MCLAIPALVIKVEGERGVVAIEGVTREVGLALTPEAKAGDYVLLHTGYAIGLIDEAEALRTLDVLRRMAALDAAAGEARP